MKVRNDDIFNEKKKKIMKACYDCYAENGLYGTGIAAIAKAAGVSKATLYTYFDSADDLLIQSTDYCMNCVEKEFVDKAPVDINDAIKFIDEIPEWTLKEHGMKYRLMYQVYTHPKYIEYGKKFFEGVNERYTEYAKMLEPKIGIPYIELTAFIFIFVRACVHYAMFENKDYLLSQMDVLRKSVKLMIEKNKIMKG